MVESNLFTPPETYLVNRLKGYFTFGWFLVLHQITAKRVLPGFHEFWNKWSWDFLLMPISWNALIIMESDQFIPPETYLVDILKGYFSFFYGFSYFTAKQVYLGFHESFWNKWSWDFCLMRISWYALKMMESDQFTPPETYLVDILKGYFSFLGGFSYFTAKQVYLGFHESF